MALLLISQFFTDPTVLGRASNGSFAAYFPALEMILSQGTDDAGIHTWALLCWPSGTSKGPQIFLQVWILQIPRDKKETLVTEKKPTF